jgi:choline dehydrogenase-like flavoprotein
MHYVVGSGPAGVSCAKALLAHGLDVTMLDGGLQLEPEREFRLQSMRSQPPETWSGDTGKFLKDGMTSGASGIPLKLAYGSDYPYRVPPAAPKVEFDSADSSPSYALGGLSTVWGSAVMPWQQRDMTGWPINAAELEEGYRAVGRWMPLSARTDDLATDFPLFCDDPDPMPLSHQASGMLSDLDAHKRQLNQKGISFGTARIAVAANRCVTCGLCMYGCPYRLIYSTGRTVEEMRADPHFIYIPGVVVRSVTEKGSAVTITALDTANHEVKFEADRVYLAAGVYNTSAILLRSLNLYNRPVRLFDSQYFLLPALRFASAGKVTQENLHTLAQLFLEVMDPAISPHTIHLQTYTYNDLFVAPIEQKLGPLRPLFPLQQFLSRLILFQGYLHSTHSAQLVATLIHRGSVQCGSDDVLQVRGLTNPETRPTLKKLIRKLLALAPAMRAVPLVPLLQTGKPGRGYHSGGTFPMRISPSAGETDIYGRPAGLARVHAVDSTIFPSVAATTITLTAMANAYRIGSAVDRYS